MQYVTGAQRIQRAEYPDASHDPYEVCVGVCVCYG